MKKFIRDYLIIFAIIVIMITVLRLIFAPNQYFELRDMVIYMVCSLVANLASLVFYSKKELSEKEMRLRIVIHFIILELGLLSIANIMDWVTGVLNTTLFALQIAFIYVLVRWLIWKDDNKSAQIINQKLKEINNKPAID